MCVALALLAAARVRAEPTLQWSAPRTCPTAAEVQQQLDRLRVERGPFVSEALVRATIRRTSRRAYALELTVELGDRRVERQLEAPSCQSVTRAASWFIAMTLQTSAQEPLAEAQEPASAEPPASTESAPTSPDIAEAARPTPPSPDVPTPPPPEPPALASQARTTLRFESPGARERTRWWRAGAFAGSWVGGLPAAQATAGLRAGVGYGALYGELTGSWAFARTRELEEDVRARFTTQQLGLHVCAQWGARLRLGPCAGIALLRSEGRARNAMLPTERTLLWASAGLSVQLGWLMWRSVELMADAGVELPISARPEFSIEGLGRVAEASPTSFYARLGVGYRAAARKERAR